MSLYEIELSNLEVIDIEADDVYECLEAFKLYFSEYAEVSIEKVTKRSNR